jgi:ubiquinone biosynthesis protein
MGEQVGWRGFADRIRREAPYWSAILPQLPRLLHQALQRQAATDEALAALAREGRRRNRLLMWIVILLGSIVVLLFRGT